MTSLAQELVVVDRERLDLRAGLLGLAVLTSSAVWIGGQAVQAAPVLASIDPAGHGYGEVEGIATVSGLSSIERPRRRTIPGRRAAR